MDVDPHKSVNSPHGPHGPVRSKPKKATQKSGPNDVDQTDPGSAVFAGSELQDVIRSSLDSMPEVRRQLVETGRELAQDDDYPSAEGLDDLSRLALRQFSEEQQARQEQEEQEER
jgi:hypothetical protein